MEQLFLAPYSHTNGAGSLQALLTQERSSLRINPMQDPSLPFFPACFQFWKFHWFPSNHSHCELLPLKKPPVHMNGQWDPHENWDHCCWANWSSSFVPREANFPPSSMHSLFAACQFLGWWLSRKKDWWGPSLYPVFSKFRLICTRRDTAQCNNQLRHFVMRAPTLCATKSKCYDHHEFMILTQGCIWFKFFLLVQ